MYGGASTDPVTPTPTQVVAAGCSGAKIELVIDPRTAQLVLLPELAALVQNHMLNLIDPEIAPLELEAVASACDRHSDDRRLLAGIGAVDPEVRPWVCADGELALSGPRT